ncbi:hypothetical protein ROZALSC1DRAFT_26568 [Rozella allomycis CSF55]|uniref:Uncharacterized protein n=1 Tax=Rozella allomycis (strain CSF55) TaxID=988480 RepID=A0A075AX10_ROZAC|nr:hypothetical protein O9G_002982 [Rozella allomycis CSF55]RKP22055.1 hypothetical protein ROZALSC1DRAFT_26568 [Rozella allomycis CSF55]|eukprot:EPZ34664.1 hypothetical protein O9G_002982 [Rozella allomycis CSF55]
MKYPIGFNSPRYTQSKDLEKAYNKHCERLKSMEANVDNHPPKIYDHLVNNAKSSHIDKVLLKRMNHHFTRNNLGISAPPWRMSRNTFSEHRLRQVKQIEKDNERINDNFKVSYYSKEKMATEEKKREEVLQIMSHFRGVPRSIPPTKKNSKKESEVKKDEVKAKASVNAINKSNKSDPPKGRTNYYHSKKLIVVDSPYTPTYNYKNAKNNILKISV